MATRSPLFLAILAFAALLCFAQAKQNANNLLRAGRGPNSGQILSFRHYSLDLQDNCNLVLKDKIQNKVMWQSNTQNKGTGCTVQLQRQGQFIIRDNQDNEVARFPRNNPRSSDSVAVMHPDGKVAIYGPRVWSRPQRPRDTLLESTQRVQNIIFSGQNLNENEQLQAGKHHLTMQDDCNLVLSSGWQSNTSGQGKYCFARLNHFGQLEIRDDKSNNIWSNDVQGREGDYVAALFEDGMFAVYGPQLWSTEQQNDLWMVV